MKDAICLEGIRKTYKNKTAVDGISLTIPQGIIFALLGVNGAGKTTTIRMLNGLAEPTGGSAHILGMDLGKDLAKIKEISDVSPQETSVAPNLTVWENLIFMAEIYGCDKAEAEKRAEALVAQFSLEEVRHSRAKILSGGWQRRLSIAMALVSNPKILYLDEPTLGLDVLARQELWEILKGLWGTVTILLTTHYMEEAEALADRVAVMVKGQIRAQGTVEQLKEMTGQDSLEKAFIHIAKEVRVGNEKKPCFF